jgi:hypothetical protein
MLGRYPKARRPSGLPPCTKKTDELRHKSLPPSSAAKHRRNFDCLFLLLKRNNAKKASKFRGASFYEANSSGRVLQGERGFLCARPSERKKIALHSAEVSTDGGAFPLPCSFNLMHLFAHPTGAYFGTRSGNRMRRHSIRCTSGFHRVALLCRLERTADRSSLIEREVPSPAPLGLSF